MINLREGDLFHRRYRIVAPLGTGGVGTVYLANQIDSHREVAIKLLQEESLSSETERKRFLREFRILSTLSHEHIITFYSAAISDEGAPYAVCEYIKGRSLYSVMRLEGRVSWPRLANIVMQVCDAMQFAHEAGIIHRDLKPENIMLLDKPEPDWVKVLDFGFAFISSPGQLDYEKLTATGIIVGTVCYMSPEHCKGEKVDARSDIYALACIIYEALSGKLLFESDNELSIVRMHLNQDPAPILDALKNEVPQKLIDVLLKALDKNPDRRHKSMLEFKRALESVPMEFTSTGAQKGKLVFDRGLAAKILALNLLVLVVVLATLWLSMRKQEEFQTLIAEIDKNKIHQKKKDVKISINRRFDSAGLYEDAKVLFKAGELEAAHLKTKESMRQARLIDDKNTQYNCLMLLSRIYLQKKELAQCRESAAEALNYSAHQFSKLSIEYLRALELMAVSLVGDERALVYFNKCFKLWSELGLDANEELVDLLSNYLEAVKKTGKGELEEELARFQKAFDSSAGSLRARTRFYILQALTLIDAGKKKQAELAAEKVVNLVTNEGASLGNEELISSHLQLCIFYRKDGNLREAYMQMEAALKILRMAPEKNKFRIDEYSQRAAQLRKEANL